MINRKVGLLVIKDQNQLNANFTLFLKPTNGIMWANSQINHAIKPLKKTFGRSATALYLAIMARLPLS